MLHRGHGCVRLRRSCRQLKAVQLLCCHTSSSRMILILKAFERRWIDIETRCVLVQMLLLGHHPLLLHRQKINCIHQQLQFAIHRVQLLLYPVHTRTDCHRFRITDTIDSRVIRARLSESLIEASL